MFPPSTVVVLMICKLKFSFYLFGLFMSTDQQKKKGSLYLEARLLNSHGKLGCCYTMRPCLKYKGFTEALLESPCPIFVVSGKQWQPNQARPLKIRVQLKWKFGQDSHLPKVVIEYKGNGKNGERRWLWLPTSRCEEGNAFCLSVWFLFLPPPWSQIP